MNGGEEKSGGNDKDGPFSKWFSWGHVAVTIALAGLLVNLWGKWRDAESISVTDRIRMESRITVLESEVKTLYRLDTDQNAVSAQAMASLVQRLDAQRDDIRSIQNNLNRHMDKDRR